MPKLDPERKERIRKAIELRKGGATYQQIANQLGYSDRGSAYNAVKGELNKLNRESATQLRDLEVGRLDAMLLGIWQQAKNSDLPSIDRVLKIMDRRAKLLGLDAAQQVDLRKWDLNNATDDQLERIANGEDPARVMGSDA